jgi:peroxiredoxin
MTIQVGNAIPSMTLKMLTADGMQDVDTKDLFAGKTSILFTVPAAFSPACSAQHVPGYLDKLEDFRAKGVDQIVCLAVNDPFTMDAWAKSQGVGDKIVMLPDGNGALTQALGLELDMSGVNAGQRAKRAALLVKDGVVSSIHVEDSPGSVDVSSAESMLAKAGA